MSFFLAFDRMHLRWKPLSIPKLIDAGVGQGRFPLRWMYCFTLTLGEAGTADISGLCKRVFLVLFSDTIGSVLLNKSWKSYG